MMQYLGLKLRLVAAVAVLSGLAGCGGESLPTGTVTGKVSYKGTPVQGGMITFSSETASPTATIGSDGTYTLMIAGEEDVPAGTYKVTVLPPAPPENSSMEVTKPVPMVQNPSFPKPYSQTSTTPLTATIKADEENVLDFNME